MNVKNVDDCKYVYTFLSLFPDRMNLLAAASRGGGILQMVPELDEEVVLPGKTMREVTEEALKRIPPPYRQRKPVHVYIMAGLPDISTKLEDKDTDYKECVYRSHPDESLQHFKRELNHCTREFKKAGAIPIFCTVTHCNLQTYNTSLLDKNMTTYLKHQHEYATMQTPLNNAIDIINEEIPLHNRRITPQVATPFLHSAIRKRTGGGKKRRSVRYRLDWKGLKDGCHGTPETRATWAKSIKSAIKINRNNLDDSSDEEPKRAWRRDRYQ